MKFIATGLGLLILLLSGVVSAEEKVWYCHTVSNERWVSFSNGSWELESFPLQSKYVIKQNGSDFSFSEKERFQNPTCGESPSGPSWKYCVNSYGDSLFRINTQTGLATFTTTLGWMKNKSDFLAQGIQALECSTF